MGVVGDVAVEVGLAGLAGRQLHHVDVGLDQRDAAAEVEQLLPPGHLLGIEAAGVDQDVDPFVGRELARASR